MEDASKIQQVLYGLRLHIEGRYRSQVLDESVRRPFSPKMTADRRKIDTAALCLNDSQGFDRHCPESRRKLCEAIIGYEDQAVPGRQAFEGIVGCGNKTVPIYVFAREDHHHPSVEVPMAQRRRDIFQALDGYVHQTWFRSFETNIDCEQKFAKIIVPRLEPRRSANGHGQFGGPSWINLARAYVGVALTLSKGLCDSFVQVQAVAQDSICQFRCFKIRPLFRALAIVLLEQDYDECCTAGWNSAGINKMRVLLVSTGVTEGLSGPIKLPGASGSPLAGGDDHGESIGPEAKPGVKVDIEITTLEKAVRFVMEMEEREKKVMGQLDFVENRVLSRSLIPYRHGSRCHSFLFNLPRHFAWDLGWDGQDISGPSSSWVDVNKYRYPQNLYNLSVSAVLQFPNTDRGRYHVWSCAMSQKKRIVALWAWHTGLSAEERDKISGRRSGMWIFRFRCSQQSGISPNLAHITSTSRPILLAAGHKVEQESPT